MNTNNNIPDFDLNNFKKENPFKVPANYFDDLPQTIQNKITDLPKSESIFDKLMIIFSPKFGVAFAAILILVLVLTNDSSNPEVIKTDYFSDINVDYETVVENIDLEEDGPLIAELYQPTKNKVVETINNNEDDLIIDYLLENDLNENDLY